MIYTEVGPDNAAYDRLLTDYVHYHAALALVGGAFAVLLAATAATCFVRTRRTRGWIRRWYALLGAGSLVVSSVLGLIVAANVSNVIAPQRGVAGMIAQVTAGDQASLFAEWMESGDPKLPIALQGLVDDRLAWQFPKAVICTLLLAVTAYVAVRIWRRILSGEPTVKQGPLVLGGSLTVVAGLLLMLMVMGNTQAAYAPIGMTLLFG